MPTLPVSTLPAPSPVPTSTSQPLPIGPLVPDPPEASDETDLPPIEPSLLPASRGPGAPSGAVPTGSERIIDLPETSTLSVGDFMVVDADGPGTRKISQDNLKARLGVTRVVPLVLNSGPVDDFGLIEIGDSAVIQATVWAPDQLTGKPYACGMEIVFAPARSLRIGLRKGLISSGRVDVVLTGG